MTPRRIVERLEIVIGLDGRPVRLVDVVEQELVSFFGCVPIQAAEHAEKTLRRVGQLIEENRADAEAAGVMPTIVISGDNDRAVCGSCWIESFDEPEVRAAKQRRLYVEPIYRAIRGLTFAEFERFGSRILTELGASAVRVTPHSNDQGIDFYGILRLSDLGTVPAPFLQMAQEVTLRFAGQAKHYPDSSLGPGIVRELVGSVMLARYGIHSSTVSPFQDFGLLALHPLLGMIFTTGRVTSGAMKVANEAGIMVRSGEQLSVFLADRGVGYLNGEFNLEEFRRWLLA
jgi:hypothetical protein